MVEVFVLGGGTPTPTEFRFGSAHVLRIGDEVLMFDCGPAATHKLVKAGLYPTQVGNLFSPTTTSTTTSTTPASCSAAGTKPLATVQS